MFNNKRIFGFTGPTVFLDEIKSMIPDALDGIGLYITGDKEVDLDYNLSQIDALVLSGGNDIFRGSLGEPITHGDGLSKFDIRRDRREKYLLEKCLESGKPILGICRGFQVICTHFGHNLMPHLFGDVVHSPGDLKINYEHGEFCHYVECLPEFEDKYFKGSEGVTSYHHQGIYYSFKYKSLNGLDVVATAITNSDSKKNVDVAEIVESKKYKIVACQFHAEADWEYGNIASNKVLERFKSFLE